MMSEGFSMGQLERYGLYVLCIVISLILGIAIWGGDPAISEAGSRGDLLGNGRADERQLDEPFRTAPKILAADAEPVQLPAFLAPVADDRAQRGPELAPVQPDPVPSERPGPVALRTHKVVEDDTLEKLAAQYLGRKSRWPEIKALNPSVDEKNLRLGTELKIPAPEQALAKSPASGRNLMPDEYLVVDRDSPARISRKLFGTEAHAQRIMDLNGIDDPLKLKPGAVLKVPMLEAAARK